MSTIIVKRTTLFLTHRFVYTQCSKNTCVDDCDNLRHMVFFVLELMLTPINMFSVTQIETNNKMCVHGLVEKSCILF